MTKPQEKTPATPTEDEVLRRMLSTPPAPHKAKPEPVARKKATK